MKYNIEGGNLPVVICYPEAGQTVCCEGGSMSWMSPNMRMETSAGGFRKAFGRLFSGESIFLNEYTAMGAEGMIAFASSFPGSIIPYRVTPGNGIIVQKGGFLAMEKGMELSVWFQKKLGGGFFGGEGFIMQRISGDGLVFLEIDGYCKEYTLGVGQTVIVDTGYLAAMTDGCTMDIESVKGIKNKFLGGEGFFNTRITGPGKVYIQSMPIANTASCLIPYLPFDPHNDAHDGPSPFRF
ncbi:MAG: TIGR00266 family protein [Ruminococcaceae bacterium]|nr:TIGR00266 family protein [Oscillospiraceae bacterium]